MKRILLLVAVSVLVCSAFAQEKASVPVQNFEGELYLGVTGAMFNMDGYQKRASINFGGELRYNLRKVPVAVGVFAETYYPDRKYKDPDTPFNFENNGGGLYGITGEYDFRRGKMFNPYASVAFGLGNLHVINEDSKCTPAFRLKAGLELVYHIRISASVTFTKRDLCGFGVHLGGVIGGRPKKK